MRLNRNGSDPVELNCSRAKLRRTRMRPTEGGEGTYLVSPEEHGSEEASVDGGLVHHHTIFLIIAAVAGDRYNGIVACWQLSAKSGKSISTSMYSVTGKCILTSIDQILAGSGRAAGSESLGTLCTWNEDAPSLGWWLRASEDSRGHILVCPSAFGSSSHTSLRHVSRFGTKSLRTGSDDSLWLGWHVSMLKSGKALSTKLRCQAQASKLLKAWESRVHHGIVIWGNQVL